MIYTKTTNRKITALKYTKNAILHYFSSIAHRPWAMLLKSGGSYHKKNNRFDILTAEPLSTLTTVRDTTTLIHNGVITYFRDDPLDLVQQQCNALGVSPDFQDHLPFQGGALGLFGYDLARRFEVLPQNSKKDLLTPDMAIGIYDWALIADHYLKKLTLISINDSHSRVKWLLAQEKNTPQLLPFMLTSKWQSNLSFQDYNDRFISIKKYIKDGDCYQVNLGQRFQVHYCGNEWQAFLYLNQFNKASFSAFLKLPNSVLLSFSPERFLSLKKDNIETSPIKGTIPRIRNKILDLKQIKKLIKTEKEIAENLMIVDLLRSDIGRVAIPGSVNVPQLFEVESLPMIHHMVSTIHASLLPTLSPLDLLRACFPGGSITGAPKIRAMEIIEELEPHCRNAWCGSIGYISLCNRMDMNINIRTIVAENKQLYCSAGGGIVAESLVQSEYKETLCKVYHILSLS